MARVVAYRTVAFVVFLHPQLPYQHAVVVALTGPGFLKGKKRRPVFYFWGLCV